jgi:four helix bundle protein
MNYPLEERTYDFGRNTLITLKQLPLSITNKPLITQVTRSCTSVGANYCEANGASSSKDFKNKIYICKKESQESRYWLRLLSELNPKNSPELEKHTQEAKELAMIFGKIISTLNTKNN